MPDMTNVTTVDENAILKEVWNTAEVSAKTELNDEQIQSVNKLLSMSKLFGNAFLEDNVKSFMTLQKSRNRQSMKEFVEVVGKKNDGNNMPMGFMGKMMG